MGLFDKLLGRGQARPDDKAIIKIQVLIYHWMACIVENSLLWYSNLR